MLFLRSVGADKYLQFQEKPHLCPTCVQMPAREIGISLDAADPSAIPFIRELETGHFHERVNQDGAREAVFIHPLLTASPSYPLEGPDFVTAPSVEQAAAEVYKRLASESVCDITAAEELRAPLAAPVDRIVGDSRKPENIRMEDEVALQLSLPVFEGLPLGDLLKLRSEHSAEFECFRLAVVQAMREVAQRASEERDPAEIAMHVRREFLEPAVASIDRSLQASRRLFRGKALGSVAVGAVGVGIGALHALPWMAGAVLPMLSAKPAWDSYDGYRDEKRDLELNDMYFLWRAKKLSAR